MSSNTDRIDKNEVANDNLNVRLGDLPLGVSKATYSNVFGNASVEYILEGANLKENIVLYMLEGRC